MANFYEQVTHFKDQVGYLFHHPGYVKAELASDHQLLVEVIGIGLLICLLLLALFKPAAPKNTTPETGAEAPAPLPQTKKTPPAAPIKRPRSEQAQTWIKREPPSIHELSLEEEQALNQAMAIAGKQALAEVTGAPHQAEFFQTNDAAEAAKKMFARQKTEAQTDPATQGASKLEFVILYFMAPRSHVFENEQVFQLLQDQGLSLNDQHVFEYYDGHEVLFYVSSALKPGHFDLHTVDASVPGLSFVLDLAHLEHARTAFNKMLEVIHTLAQHLKGDILDENRQRLTQTSVNMYMTRVKARDGQR